MNGRLDTLQAAVLLAKLTILDDEIQRRRAAAHSYTERLSDVVETPAQLPGSDTIWAQYTIQLPHRDAVAASLRQRGIPTQIYYPLPMHLQPAYAQYGEVKGSLPVSERLCQRVLALPMHPYLEEATIETICDGVRQGLQAV